MSIRRAFADGRVLILTAAMRVITAARLAAFFRRQPFYFWVRGYDDVVVCTRYAILSIGASRQRTFFPSPRTAFSPGSRIGSNLWRETT